MECVNLKENGRDKVFWQSLFLVLQHASKTSRITKFHTNPQVVLLNVRNEKRLNRKESNKERKTKSNKERKENKKMLTVM